ncbi:MAG: hypothetical protein GF331_27445 [Chitinivibrionales bacterium]|nr:hypothetical protein [Chitinivibrionales bacterium]
MMAEKRNEKPLRTVLVGCGRMGRRQAQIIAGIDDYELVAVADTFGDAAKAAGEELGVAWYDDYREMYQRERPEVVAVCTSNDAHAAPTIAAAEAGVRAVYCEKPMAVDMGEARRMVEVCESNGVELVINHQRRLGPDLTEMRRVIESGALGDITLMRASNAGDILSDGTHAVDSLLWLAGDVGVQWVVGEVHRWVDDHMREQAQAQAQRSGRPVEAGFRYGHPVENGGIGVFMLEGDIRCELYCGDMRDGYRAYQDYEIVGTKGRLWRTGDRAPNVYVQDGERGTHQPGVDDKWAFRPIANDAGGAWKELELPERRYENGIEDGYRRLVARLRSGDEHPMNGRNALRGFEIVMAIYESARTHRRIEPPLQQERFPLQLMVDELMVAD